MNLKALSLDMLLYSELNIIAIIIMVIIAVNAARIKGFNTAGTVMFVTSVLLAAAANLCDFFWNAALNKFIPMSTDLREMINLWYFIFLGASCYCWFMYTETVFENARPGKKVYALCAIPFYLLTLLMISTLLTKWVYWIDDIGGYHRGKLFYLQHILSYGYIVAASGMCFRRGMMKSNYDRREELLAMASFVIPPFISIIAQIFFQNLPILSVAIVVSFILALIDMLKDMISIDTLTEIPGRREMLKHLARGIRETGARENIWFLFIDIDRFKYINDTFGHDEGDRALKTMAQVLMKIRDETNGFCARYGGDEFAVAVRCDYDREYLWIKERIKVLAGEKSLENGLKSVLSVSVGAARYRRDMSGIQQLIAEADADMYREKQEHKLAKKNSFLT